MPGESQETPITGSADPTTRTMEQIAHQIDDSEATVDAKFDAIVTRLDGIDKATELLHNDFTRFPTEVQKEVGHLSELFDIRLMAEKEISQIREAYRIELKADSKEALSTAMIAAEKAVQAALAAAEKAREQETIRTQLANDKTERTFIEALRQQQETFAKAIENIIVGQNDLKEALIKIEQRQFAISESRVEQRAQQTDQRGGNQQWIALAAVAVAIVSVLIAAGAFK